MSSEIDPDLQPRVWLERFRDFLREIAAHPQRVRGETSEIQAFVNGDRVFRLLSEVDALLSPDVPPSPDDRSFKDFEASQ